MKTRRFLFKGINNLFLFRINWWRVIVFSLLTISLIPLPIKAQVKLWDKTFGGNSTDGLTSIQQTRDGGYIVGGYSFSSKSGDKTQANRGEEDFWVVKLNANGSKAWDKTFGGSTNDHLDLIQQTKDGGFILIGSSNSGKSGDKTDATPGIWMVKLKADGNKEWDKIIGGTNDVRLSSMQLASNGDYILGGIFYTGTGSIHYWVAKINADGSKEWEKTYGGNRLDVLRSLITTPDGGYLMGGYSNSDKMGDKSEPRKSDCTDGSIESNPCYDYWVVKIKADGTKQWDKTYGGYESDALETIVATPDGGYLLGGTSISDKSLDKSEPTRDETEDEAKGDYWLIKIKADGTKVWDKTLGGNKKDFLGSILVTPDGGFLLSGHSESERGGDMGMKRGIGNTWIIKINNQGKKIWDTSLESGFQMVPAADSNIVLAGSTSEYPNSDYWVVKILISDKKVQTITFNPADPGVTDKLILKATASSGLPVTFKLLSGPAIQKGNKLSFTGYGTVVVKVSQAGNDSYIPVEYTTSFRVQRFPKRLDKTIGGDKLDILADMVATPDGGYLLAGSSSSSISGDKSMASRGSSDYWLVKVDATKKKKWDKSFGGKGTETLTTIIPTQDGGYLLGGSSASGKEGDKREASKGEDDYWLVKVDATGNKLWDKSFGGDKDDNLIKILATPDGGYLLGGYSNSDKGGDKSEEAKKGVGEFRFYDYWLVKINSQGQKLWDKTLGTPDDDVLTSLIATPDGGYLLGGMNGIEDVDYAYGNYWIVKINAQGQPKWDNSYNRDHYDKLTAMITTPDGGYLLAGYSGQHTFVYWLVKIDAKGTKIWEKEYRGATIFDCDFCETHNAIPVDILATPTGNYLLANYIHSGQGADRSEENRGQDDYWLLEIDANGQRIADKSYGGTGPDKLTAIIATPNGGYLLGGSSNSPSSYEKSENSRGDYDFWLVETEISSFPPPTLDAWNLRYGGSSSDYLTTILPTNDGGYLLGGYSYSQQSGDKTQNSYGKSDYWLVKTDGTGKKLWDKHYGGTGDDYLKSIVPTPDGDYLLGGSSESGSNGNKTASSKGGRDFWLVKISSSGEKEWDYSYGGRGMEDLKKVRVLHDGTYLLAGYSNSPVSGNKSQSGRGGLDYWVVKVDRRNGEKLWDKRFGGTADDYLEDVLVLGNGDLLLGGGSFSSQEGDRSQASQGSSDYWLVRTDGIGKKLWDKRYGGSEPDHLFALLSTPNNTILLAGQSASLKSGNKSQPAQGKKDFWLVQVNSKGEPQWDKTFGGSGEEPLRSLTHDKDGGYLLGGSSSSGKSSDKSQDSQGGLDYWLVKTNRKGEKLWDKRYGGSQEEELRVVWPTEDGGYLLGGRSNSGVSGDRTQPSQGENDFWLVKVAPNTTSLVAEKEASQEPELTKVDELSSLTVYPNPSSELVTISFSLPQTQVASIKMYDSQGRK